MIEGCLLGTGTSTGVPVIGCSCTVCTSADPRDSRLRCACYLRVDGIRLLIDAGPDFRQQAIRHGVDDVDAVLITHHHFDHVAGLDDLRPFLFEGRPAIPCYAHADSLPVLESMFSYIFKDGSYPGVPRLELREAVAPFQVHSRTEPAHSTEVIPIPAIHGDLPVFGFRIGSFAYLTDISDLPESSLSLLQDLDVLVLDALRDKPHPMHLTIDAAVELAGRIDAKQSVFIHMSHDTLHADLEARMPTGMQPGYDGLRFRAR